MLATAALTALVVPPAGASEKPEPTLVNEELVVAELAPSGLPVDATLYSRITAYNYPIGDVRDPSSTAEVRYLDRRGAPATDGSAVVVPVGGDGETSVTTKSDFDKPLPVAMHVEYAQGPTILPPQDVPAAAGEMGITYTVTNTTARRQVIRYRTADGRWRVVRQPVFAPFAGTLQVTLPAGMALLSAPGAVRSTTPDGRTQLQFNLVLYPPVGDYEKEVHLLVEADPLAVPTATLQVVPVQSRQSPSQRFGTDLLVAADDGNRRLFEGLAALDEATAELAEGAAELTRGLMVVGRGTGALAAGVNGRLVPGAQQLAQGADQLAGGQQEAAEGTQSAADGAADLQSGASELTKAQKKAAKGAAGAVEGADALQEGTTALADGLTDLHGGLQKLLAPKALPAARDSAEALSEAILRLRDAIGTAGDPSVPFPPNVASSLVQATRASGAAASKTAAGAGKIAENLKQIAQDLADIAARAGDAAALAASSQAKATVVYQQACVDATLLNPAQCTLLRQAAEDAGNSATAAGSAALGAGKQAVRVGAQALATGAVAIAAGAIQQSLAAVESGLVQVSLALVSGSQTAPGVYEGLVALTDGLTATIAAVVALSNGAAASAGGAQELDDGSQDLSDGLQDLSAGQQELAEGSAELGAGATDLDAGLSDLADGSQQLAQGAQELADGTAAQSEGTEGVGRATSAVDEAVTAAADGASQLSRGTAQLQEQGASAISRRIARASRESAFARAYLRATEQRAADALPYGAPDGAAGRVAYVYTLPGGEAPGGVSGALARWGLFVVVAAALAATVWRRLGTAGRPAGEADTSFAPAPDEVVDNWPFGDRPEDR